jgi:archaemetzincin
MKLIIQPIELRGKKILGSIPYIISALLPVFGFEKEMVIINKPITEIPSQLFDSKRNQYNSDYLLSWLLRTLQAPNASKVLAVCDFDAYFGNYNYCFGEAIIGGRVAVIYLQRLLPWSGDGSDNRLQTLFQDRLVKEAIHELGHTFGLRHCYLDTCTMYKSQTISDTDRKGKEFCHRCLIALLSPSVLHSK